MGKHNIRRAGCTIIQENVEMVQGLPDWTKGIAVNVTAESAEYPTVIGVRPLGTTIVHNTVTVTEAWGEIVSYTPPAGYRFYLAKVNVYVTYIQYWGWQRVKLDDKIIDGGCMEQDTYWESDYPFGVYLDGDDTKKVKVEANWIGAAAEWEGTIFGELVEL